MKLTSEELRNLYGHEYAKKHANPPIARIYRLLNHIECNPNDIVVDFACGDGILLEAVHNKVKEYVGVDFSAEQIKLACERQRRLKISNSTFCCQDIVEFCERNQGKFDKAFAFDFVEHIYDDDFMLFFSAIHKTLNDHGVLYIHTPNSNFFLEKFKTKGIIRQFPEHIAVRSGEEYTCLLRLTGFANITIKHLSHYNILKCLQVFSYLPSIIGKYFQARLLIVCLKQSCP